MMRLLLVEDELEIQTFVKQSLKGAGYEVHTAEDGNAAALLAAKQVYEGMIVDLGLPDQDGIDLILKLRKSGDQPRTYSFGETVGRRPCEGPRTRRGRLPDEALRRGGVAGQDAQSTSPQFDPD
jgi:CheY-like chemotaxis protein